MSASEASSSSPLSSSAAAVAGSGAFANRRGGLTRTKTSPAGDDVDDDSISKRTKLFHNTPVGERRARGKDTALTALTRLYINQTLNDPKLKYKAYPIS
jgi:hypothetical protein